MNFGTKLIVVAVLALSTGIAFAFPLAILPLNIKSFPRVPEGPKADFSVEFVYASFLQNAGNATYMIVLNVTNLSGIEAKISEVGFVAAQDVKIIPSALGGFSFANGEGPGVDFGGVVKGVWLDNEWLNTTWIPGTDYPFNLIRIVTPDHSTANSVPELSANAAEEGTWIEGVPIAEYYNSTALTSTSIYINGSWVDVTGRVRADPEQPTVMASNTLVDQILPFSGQHYANVGNASVGPTTEMPSWKMYNGNGPTYLWPSKADAFNNTWAGHQSRLIVLNGSLMFGVGPGFSALAAGKITLYAWASSYVNDWLVNGVYYNTVSTATRLNTVQMENTAAGYMYNVVLGENQMFQLDQYGVEAFIEPRS